MKFISHFPELNKANTSNMVSSIFERRFKIILQIKSIILKFVHSHVLLDFMTLKIGDIAPDFTLYNTDRTETSLSELQGKQIVLLFFPFAFSSTCTSELCSVRDDINNYRDLNAEVIGISNDSMFSLKRYREDQNLNFLLLSDYNKTVSEDYNTLYDEFILGTKRVTKRAAFVIGEDGKIKYAEILENSGDIPDLNKIKELLK
jgi:peroxiredoxin